VGWAFGLLCGSVGLTWLYLASHRSILAVALWHTAYNFGTATQAGGGVPAAVLSTLVMCWAAALLVQEARQATKSSQLRTTGREASAPGVR
jgi:membrane protease YdiL (CAAX protease family)